MASPPWYSPWSWRRSRSGPAGRSSAACLACRAASASWARRSCPGARRPPVRSAASRRHRRARRSARAAPAASAGDDLLAGVLGGLPAEAAPGREVVPATRVAATPRPAQPAPAPRDPLEERRGRPSPPPRRTAPPRRAQGLGHVDTPPSTNDRWSLPSGARREPARRGGHPFRGGGALLRGNSRCRDARADGTGGDASLPAGGRRPAGPVVTAPPPAATTRRPRSRPGEQAPPAARPTASPSCGSRARWSRTGSAGRRL